MVPRRHREFITPYKASTCKTLLSKTSLTGADGARQEVDLVPPVPPGKAAATLPEPVCPAGVVTGMFHEGQEEPPAPGASPLDEGLQRLRESWPGTPGGEA